MSTSTARTRQYRARKQVAKGQPLTDLRLARLFAQLHGRELRYLPALRQWWTWRDGRWQPDVFGAVPQAAVAVADFLLREAKTAEQQDAARKVQAAARHAAMIRLAEGLPHLIAQPEDFDANPCLIGCRDR